MEKNIANIVGQNFIRSCKDHNYYYIFKEQSSKRRKIYDTISGAEHSNLQSLFKSFHDEVKRNLHSGANKYDETTLMTNILIKSYLERGGVNPMRLEGFGREVFERSCIILFGDEFKKYQEEENKVVNSFKTDFERYAYRHYTGLKQCHVIPSDMSFGIFIRKFGETIKKMQKMEEMGVIHNNLMDASPFGNAPQPTPMNFDFEGNDEDEGDTDWL